MSITIKTEHLATLSADYYQLLHISFFTTPFRFHLPYGNTRKVIKNNNNSNNNFSMSVLLPATTTGKKW